MNRGIATRILVAALLLTPAGCGSAESEAQGRSYLERLESLETRLLVSEPSPQSYGEEVPPENVQRIHYPSGDLSLMGWFAMPERAVRESGDAGVPGVVYFHGGFAFGSGDFADAQPFLDAGFALLTPALRGENGNPGSFEMFLGEIDDAVAAIRWLGQQPGVDPDRIYAFGHSVGGNVSALVSLRADVPVVHTGSSGGLYPAELFEAWSDIVPFDATREEERSVRLLMGNQRWMQRPHHAFMGTGDSGRSAKRDAEAEVRDFESRLEVTVLPGDHMSSLHPSIEAYVELIRAQS